MTDYQLSLKIFLRKISFKFLKMNRFNLYMGRFGRMAMKHVKYHVGNELPVQVRSTMLDAWGWCTGTAQRDGMGRDRKSVV